MYKPTIGLEIHAELSTNSKLFCGCKNDPNEKEPNSLVCPVCTGYPGAMPYIQKEAMEKVLKVGSAVSGEFADFTEFDRKHYFYPDIPKGYQISQHKHPLVSGGKIFDIEIERIHLEEDTAKNIHTDTDESLIDYNRSGVPLMELVTKPVIRNAEDAVCFVEELQLILRMLDVSMARMEWGEMRVEVNISISKDEELGNKVEIKNLNSTKVVKKAIEYEIKRQEEVLESGGTVTQETRGWNENKSKTESQRKKESSHEYRYFPDPDIPKFNLSLIEEFQKDHIKKNLPKLPKDIRTDFKQNYKLKENDVETLLHNQKLLKLFCDVLSVSSFKKENAQTLANFLTSDSISLIDKFQDSFYTNITKDVLAEIVSMFTDDKISSRGAKDILSHIAEFGGVPSAVAKEKSLYQQSDKESIDKLAQEIIKENPTVVEQIKNGNESVIQFLVGKGMQKSKGSTNPQLLKNALKSNIK